MNPDRLFIIVCIHSWSSRFINPARLTCIAVMCACVPLGGTWINLSSAQEDDREPSRGRHGLPFKFRKKIKAGPWWVRVRWILTSGLATTFRVQCVWRCCNLRWHHAEIHYPLGSFEAVRRSFPRVDEQVAALAVVERTGSRWYHRVWQDQAFCSPVALTPSE